MATTCESIAIFYNLHHSKGKAYTYDHKQLITKIKKYANELDPQILQQMFQNLHPRINNASENGLDSLIKF